MFLYDELQSSDKCAERLAGVLFLGPEGIADLRLRQFVQDHHFLAQLVDAARAAPQCPLGFAALLAKNAIFPNFCSFIGVFAGKGTEKACIK